MTTAAQIRHLLSHITDPTPAQCEAAAVLHIAHLRSQGKALSRQRAHQIRRIAHGLCQQCGALRLAGSDTFCPACLVAHRVMDRHRKGVGVQRDGWKGRPKLEV